MIMQIAVDAGNVFYKRNDGANIVRNKHDGYVLVDFSQQFVEIGFEEFIYIRVWFIQDNQFGIVHNSPSKQYALQLSSGQFTDRAFQQIVYA
ncbi:MAG: hypothetical protein BWZ06_01825 [Bacteroidetes bacterium ADurb.BinA261]|nr:MAG: hypothetical protein BWZ06_01825 [Bacteroidetes bacterium ADurb.BinA261]